MVLINYLSVAHLLKNNTSLCVNLALRARHYPNSVQTLVYLRVNLIVRVHEQRVLSCWQVDALVLLISNGLRYDILVLFESKIGVKLSTRIKL